MLYRKHGANPRSPLAVIRNNLQSSVSRSASRSPSFSPIPRTTKNIQKDYSIYIPVRSSSKSENENPKSVAAVHFELKSKRKSLGKQTKNLEEKVKEIRKKIEKEVRISKGSLKKPPNPKAILFCNKFKNFIIKLTKTRYSSGFSSINLYSKQLKKNQKSSIFEERLKKKCFIAFAEEIKLRQHKRKMQNAIAERHYQLQILITSLISWQEFVQLEQISLEDKSYNEEIDSLLQSFMNDSSIHNNSN